MWMSSTLLRMILCCRPQDWVEAGFIEILRDARVVNRVKSSRVERGATARARLSPSLILKFQGSFGIGG